MPLKTGCLVRAALRRARFATHAHVLRHFGESPLQFHSTPMKNKPRSYTLPLNNKPTSYTLSTIPVASSMRSRRELGRVALPTIQRRLALSGKLYINSCRPVTNVTWQGNRLRIRIVMEKRAGLGNRRSKKKKTGGGGNQSSKLVEIRAMCGPPRRS